MTTPFYASYLQFMDRERPGETPVSEEEFRKSFQPPWKDCSIPFNLLAGEGNYNFASGKLDADAYRKQMLGH